MIKSTQNLLKKDAEWIWTTEMEDDFECIKNAISQNISIQQFRSDWNTEVFINFSTQGLGLALIQVDPNNPENMSLVWCDSISITEAQSKLPALYGENLCLSWALNSLDFYLRGCKKFKVYTDHQALCSL